MSLLDLIDENQVDVGLGGVEAPSTTMGDVFRASLDSTARNYLTTSKTFFEGFAGTDRDKKYRELTGRSIYDDAFAFAPNGDELKQLKTMGSRPDIVKQAVDNYLVHARQQDPEKYGQVKNSAEISEDVKNRAKESLKTQAKTVAGATTAGSVLGQIGGGVAASLIDPVNLATIPLGAGIASGIFKTALVEAGLNAASEVATFPFVKKWQNELGQEYGASELGENMGMSAIFGFAFGGALKAGSLQLEKYSNAAKLAKIREAFTQIKERGAENIKNQTLNTANPTSEVIQALRYEERRLHIAENDPAKYNPEVEPSIHAKNLQEVDAAINEGRPINLAKLEVTDDQIARMLPSQMDDSLAQVHSKMVGGVDDTGESIKVSATAKNELVDISGSQPLPQARRQELNDLYESPEYKAKERADFESKFGEDADIDPEERIWMDHESQDMSVKALRESFASEKEFISAISSCGIGGKK